MAGGFCLRNAFTNWNPSTAGEAGGPPPFGKGGNTKQERNIMMKAIVTVIGKDRVGIIASVCALLSQHSINILDITQTVLQEYLTMVMLVDLTACETSIGEIGEALDRAGREQGLSIRIQREDIFNAMHRI